MTIIRLAIIKGTTGNNELYNRGTTPWTLIGTLGTQYINPDILTFTNKAIIANGYEIPYQYDGTTLSHLSDVPGTGSVPTGADHHALHQGFYWVWNTAETTGTGTTASLTTAFATPNANIVITARAPGAGGNAITVAYVNDGPSTPFSISVVGTAITIHLTTTGGGAIAVSGQGIIDGIAGSVATRALVGGSLAPGNDGTGVVGTLAATNLTGGAGSSDSLSDGPSSLKSSDLNNPNSWPLANQIFIDKDDGDQGMGMGQFTIAETGISPTTSQVLFKTFSAYQMTGVFGSTNPAFSIQKIKSDMGCIGPRTIRFAPGFGLLRLTHRGVALFNGVEDTLISEEIRPLFFGNDSFRGIDWTNANLARAAVIANPPMYVLFVPTNGPALTQAFVYDLVRKAWTVLSYPEPIASFDEVTNPNSLPTALVGDYSAGHIRSVFSPQDQGDDDGVPIQWSAQLRPVSAPSPQQRGYFRRAILKVFDTRTAGQHIYWVAMFGPQVNATPPQRFGTITLPMVSTTVGAGAGYGLDPYGLFPYGSVAEASEIDVTIDLGVIADNLRMSLSGQGQLIIRGLEFHVRPKPLVRASSYA